MKNIKKVLLLGSGALKIGQAGEFDYSGNQAIKAMKEEKIEIILVNPNIATIQTDKGMASRIYFLPVTPYFVEKIIEKERPDGILLSFGGQTALNCGVELYKKGILSKYKIKVLGTPVETIINTEDRDLFVKKLDEIGVKTPVGIATKNTKDALAAAEKIGYPVMIRSEFALGGMGSGMAKNKRDLKNLLIKAFSYSNQILIEKYLGGWKEIEYEVVRDEFDNCITVCNMENFDPLGIHTGESIVIAPSQTLTNSEYHKLREIAIKTIRHLGIIGECNIQYALNPENEDYRVIEVNARLSRSSALASKATGYPLAFIAAKLAIGKALPDLKNNITKSTSAFFEPALDYVVVKIPRWDLKKFKNVSKYLGSEMKSVGEVMSIGRSFEEVIQKAIRMLDINMNGFVCNTIRFKDLEDELKNPTDMRIYAIAQAFDENKSIAWIYEKTMIDKWFLYKLKNIHNMKKSLKDNTIDSLLEAKKMGFSDTQIAIIKDTTTKKIRELRCKHGITPYVKQIDTLAGEFPAKTNYLYLTYHGSEHDIIFNNKETPSVIILGSGPYRIGSSVEFDWCCVTTAKAVKKMKHETIMINCNPETVSTDYDECDRLYFEELSFERVQDIYELENPKGIILSMGGQIPNNLALECHMNGLNILGTDPLNIDRAEDRNKFSSLLDNKGIMQPEWRELTSTDQIRKFAKKVDYPLLIRPSYVLSGAAMNIVNSEKEMERFMKEAIRINPKHPVVISKFIQNAKEIEFDAVARNGKIIIYAISEHVENAGIHSGDATMVFPAPRLYWETQRKIRRISESIAESLNITGPFNIQFIAKDNEVMVIECNLRASRSFPFVSKVLNHNMIELATKAILGIKVKKVGIDINFLDHVGIKASQFSFSRLKGADPLPSVEMASTGEVGCFGEDVFEALIKSVISTGMKLPEKNILISVSEDKNLYKLLDGTKMLKEMGYTIYTTAHTRDFFNKHHLKTTLLHKIREKKTPSVIDYMLKKKLDLIISIPKDNRTAKNDDDNVAIRQMAVTLSIPQITNTQLANMFIKAISKKKMEDLKIKSWDEYTIKS